MSIGKTSNRCAPCWRSTSTIRWPWKRRSAVSKTEDPAIPTRPFLREPLLHFTVAGAALFALFLLWADPPGGSDSIVVSQLQQARLAAAFTRVWRRPPSAPELKGLIDDWIREELANREAIALGLDSDDLIIRRRLRQKYETYMEQVVAATQAGETELQAFFESRSERYREPARYSFTQLYFSAERRDDPAADAAAALAELAAAGPAAGAGIGDAIALPRRLEDRRDTEISGRFGTEFADALASLPAGRWSGPLPSAYGQHLVYLEQSTPAMLPALAAVRDAVLRDWRDEQLRTAREALYQGLLERYTVVLEAPPDG